MAKMSDIEFNVSPDCLRLPTMKSLHFKDNLDEAMLLDQVVDDTGKAVVAEDAYVASSINCTHRGVEVEYQADDKCFKCATIGGSTFKVSGEKVHGFAKSSLKTYPISIEDNTLVVRMS